MNVARESPDQPEVIALIADLDAYQNTLYPPESVYALDLDSLKQPNVLFAVARDDDGAAIGCCAIVITPEFGELKRMYVQPEQRGKGVAHRVLDLLEGAAAARGCTRLTLESGPYQKEALALYARRGYEVCERFGDYPDDPFSVYMHKMLTAQAAA
jgi:putative acetyltransferase